MSKHPFISYQLFTVLHEKLDGKKTYNKKKNNACILSFDDGFYLVT